jgi:hypothetical protein
VNNASISFQNCDNNAASYIALFPNPLHKSSTANANTYYDMVRNVINALVATSQLVPNEYFMFMEIGFGGCGCYAQTDGGISVPDVAGTAMGFR